MNLKDKYLLPLDNYVTIGLQFKHNKYLTTVRKDANFDHLKEEFCKSNKLKMSNVKMEFCSLCGKSMVQDMEFFAYLFYFTFLWYAMRLLDSNKPLLKLARLRPAWRAC